MRGRHGRGSALALALLTALGSAGAATAAPADGPQVAGPASAGARLATIGTTTLQPGSQLSVEDQVVSASGRYRLVLQGDGNAVVYGPAGALWATGDRGQRLVMQHDGNLVLYASTGRATWSSGTGGSPGARLELGDDGALRLRTSSGAQVWGTSADPGAARDRLGVDDVLGTGQKLTGPNGAIVAMQNDGNLVRYENGAATWQSGSRGAGARLVLQRDGNVVVYGQQGPLWWTGTGGRGATTLVLQSDANLVLYAGATPRWHIGPGRSAAPGPAPTPTPAAVVLDLVNTERARAGCPAVRPESRLTRAAQLHSEDMAAKGYFSHDSQDGRTFSQRISAQGYGWSLAGENIAAGYPTADAVMAGWMASPGHKANILSCSFTELGVGVAADPAGRIYWTQDFATPR